MLGKDWNGNPISTFPPCYAFQMTFTALAPRLIQSISCNDLFYCPSSRSQCSVSTIEILIQPKRSCSYYFFGDVSWCSLTYISTFVIGRKKALFQIVYIYLVTSLNQYVLSGTLGGNRYFLVHWVHFSTYQYFMVKICVFSISWKMLCTWLLNGNPKSMQKVNLQKITYV